MVGEKFGRLTVMELALVKERQKSWLCLCDCGNLKVVRQCHLNSNRTKSCGCIQKEGTPYTIHGYSNRGGKNSAKSEYVAWQHMKDRCSNNNSKDFRHYGGRGITICDRWVNSFENFIIDMGLKPDSKLTLERIDVNGNYEPANCCWATRKQQTANRRINLTTI